VKFFEEANPGKRATVADIGSTYTYNARIVGTPETIADALVEWQAAGIDGVNVIYQTTPGSFAEFIDEVTPVLQKRGWLRRTTRQAHSGSAYFPAGRPH
jgi:long-chain alkane monooxygenase